MTNSINTMFQATADPTRRQILQMLNESDKAAGEIAAAFNISAPSISHHLSVLKNAKLVTTRRNGQSIVYSLNTTVMQEMMQTMMTLFKVGETPESEPKDANE